MHRWPPQGKGKDGGGGSKGYQGYGAAIAARLAAKMAAKMAAVMGAEMGATMGAKMGAKMGTTISLSLDDEVYLVSKRLESENCSSR